MFEKTLPYIGYILAAIVVILVLKLIFKLGTKQIIRCAINIVIGGLILFLINYIPGINISIDIFKSITVAFLGVIGVVIVVVYYFMIER